METVEIPDLYIVQCPSCNHPNDIFVKPSELEKEGGMVGTIVCSRKKPVPCGQKFVAFVE